MALPFMGLTRVTSAVRISCSLEAYSSAIMPRSASRMPWMMTCFAVEVAMRPKSLVCTLMRTSSPICGSAE